MAACLFAHARACLDAATVADKLALTAEGAARFGRGALLPRADAAPPAPIRMPGRPPTPCLVAPRALAQRGLGTAEGRAAFLHAIAHIEFNAVDLAWDAVYRFRGMPAEYYADWVRIADDEARHFTLLQARLAAHGAAYGDFDAHNGLWEMAGQTAHSCLARMALVPRVLEARGLDVTPGMIARLRHVGDVETVAALETILDEEVPHVAAGSRWFHWCCAREGVAPEPTFRELLSKYARGSLRGPFNVEARMAAGFSAEELAALEALAPPAR